MKQRSDSVLKNLSDDRQAQVIEWCNAPKSEKCIGGYKHAKAQLAADGFKASEVALSEFYSWWHLRRDFRRTDKLANEFEEMLKKEFPTADPKRVQEFGQALFTLQATAAHNAKEFREMEYLRLNKETAATKARQKDADLRLAERRVSVLENKITQAKEKLTKAVAKGGLSAETLKEIERAAKILS